MLLSLFLRLVIFAATFRLSLQRCTLLKETGYVIVTRYCRMEPWDSQPREIKSKKSFTLGYDDNGKGAFQVPANHEGKINVYVYTDMYTNFGQSNEKVQVSLWGPDSKDKLYSREQTKSTPKVEEEYDRLREGTYWVKVHCENKRQDCDIGYQADMRTIALPTPSPTRSPTLSPTLFPTSNPTFSPTLSPTPFCASVPCLCGDVYDSRENLCRSADTVKHAIDYSISLAQCEIGFQNPVFSPGLRLMSALGCIRSLSQQSLQADTREAVMKIADIAVNLDPANSPFVSSALSRANAILAADCLETNQQVMPIFSERYWSEEDSEGTNSMITRVSRFVDRYEKIMSTEKVFERLDTLEANVQISNTENFQMVFRDMKQVAQTQIDVVDQELVKSGIEFDEIESSATSTIEIMQDKGNLLVGVDGNGGTLYELNQRANDYVDKLQKLREKELQVERTKAIFGLVFSCISMAIPMARGARTVFKAVDKARKAGLVKTAGGVFRRVSRRSLGIKQSYKDNGDVFKSIGDELETVNALSDAKDTVLGFVNDINTIASYDDKLQELEDEMNDTRERIDDTMARIRKQLTDFISQTSTLALALILVSDWANEDSFDIADTFLDPSLTDSLLVWDMTATSLVEILQFDLNLCPREGQENPHAGSENQRSSLFRDKQASSMVSRHRGLRARLEHIHDNDVAYRPSLGRREDLRRILGAKDTHDENKGAYNAWEMMKESCVTFESQLLDFASAGKFANKDILRLARAARDTIILKHQKRALQKTTEIWSQAYDDASKRIEQITNTVEEKISLRKYQFNSQLSFMTGVLEDRVTASIEALCQSYWYNTYGLKENPTSSVSKYVGNIHIIVDADSCKVNVWALEGAQRSAATGGADNVRLQALLEVLQYDINRWKTKHASLGGNGAFEIDLSSALENHQEFMGELFSTGSAIFTLSPHSFDSASGSTLGNCLLGAEVLDMLAVFRDVNGTILPYSSGSTSGKQVPVYLSISSIISGKYAKFRQSGENLQVAHFQAPIEYPFDNIYDQESDNCVGPSEIRKFSNGDQICRVRAAEGDYGNVKAGIPLFGDWKISLGNNWFSALSVRPSSMHIYIKAVAAICQRDIVSQFKNSEILIPPVSKLGKSVFGGQTVEYGRSVEPVLVPTESPTTSPTKSPSSSPTESPSSSPTISPTTAPIPGPCERIFLGNFTLTWCLIGMVLSPVFVALALLGCCLGCYWQSDHRSNEGPTKPPPKNPIGPSQPPQERSSERSSGGLSRGSSGRSSRRSSGGSSGGSSTISTSPDPIVPIDIDRIVQESPPPSPKRSSGRSSGGSSTISTSLDPTVSIDMDRIVQESPPPSPKRSSGRSSGRSLGGTSGSSSERPSKRVSACLDPQVPIDIGPIVQGSPPNPKASNDRPLAFNETLEFIKNDVDSHYGYNFKSHGIWKFGRRSKERNWHSTLNRLGVGEGALASNPSI